MLRHWLDGQERGSFPSYLDVSNDDGNVDGGRSRSLVLGINFIKYPRIIK